MGYWWDRRACCTAGYEEHVLTEKSAPVCAEQPVGLAEQHFVAIAFSGCIHWRRKLTVPVCKTMLPDTDYAAQDHDYADADGDDADADAPSNAPLLLS